MTAVSDVEAAFKNASQAFNASFDGNINAPNAQEYLQSNWFVVFFVALNICIILTIFILMHVSLRRKKYNNYSGSINVLKGAIAVLSISLSIAMPILFVHILSLFQTDIIEHTDQVVFKDIIDKLNGNKISIEVSTDKILPDLSCNGSTCSLEIEFGNGDEVIDGSSAEFTDNMNEYADTIKKQEPWVITASAVLPVACFFVTSKILNKCCSPVVTITTKTLTFLWFPMLLGTVLLLGLYPIQAMIDEVRALPGGPTPLTSSIIHLPFDESIKAMNLTRSFINEKIEDVNKHIDHIDCSSAYTENNFSKSDCGKISQDHLFNTLCRSGIESTTYLALANQSPCDKSMTLSWPVLFAAEKLLSAQWFFIVQSKVLEFLKAVRSILLPVAILMCVLVGACSTLILLSIIHEKKAARSNDEHTKILFL